MGKVGSTALVEGIRAGGRRAIQSHFLGEAALERVLKQVTRPYVPDRMYESNLKQLNANIAATRLINRCLEGSHERLQVVTLGRDPSTWYPSELIQNLESRAPTIAAWGRARLRERCSLPSAVSCLATDMEALLTSTEWPFGDVRLHDEVGVLASTYLGTDDPSLLRVLVRETRIFLRPFAWFETFFRPVLGVDVLDEPMPEHGFRQVATDRFDVLVVRYEDLGDATDALGEFLGIRDFDLPKTNVSAKKPHASEVRRALAPLASPAVRARFTGSCYAERFGYAGSAAGRPSPGANRESASYSDTVGFGIGAGS
ncbi:MAG: putative capsular polysaccharide synthesis family protein [Nitriliruptorales bacterium]|nr:putative capsular polysaccharide synthesis family protein [Nitriliruptorales bacterium]